MGAYRIERRFTYTQAQKLKEINKLPRQIVKGAFFRVIASKHKSEPLSTKGNEIKGGRYNPPGLPALYLADSVETCIAEIKVRNKGFFDAKKYSMFKITINSKNALDLSDSRNINRIKTRRRLDLRDSENRELPQAIGMIAEDICFDVLIAPSATGKGLILAVFTGKNSKACTKVEEIPFE